MRMILVEKGRLVTIRNDLGEEITFPSAEEFHKYNPLDLAGIWYLDYEPDRGRHHTKDRLDKIEQHEVPDSKYEAVLADFDRIKADRADPLYGLEGIERADRQKEILIQAKIYQYRQADYEKLRARAVEDLEAEGKITR